MEKFKWSSLLIVLIGVIFKAEHYPGGSILLFLGLVLCSIYCIYKIFKG